MKVVGFTIVRNAIKYDYPVLESIASLLPVCDEVLVSVGKSDDDTLNLIKGIASPKIKIMETVWDDSLRKGGLRLAVETNKAMDAIAPDADWLFYIQADEVLHEDGVKAIRATMEKYKDDKRVEGLVFNYKHFYGSYSYVVEAYSHWYMREVRVVRKNKLIRSYKDAQGFRKFDTETPTHEQLMNGGVKLKVKQVDATMYHYGWVKHPSAQKAKRDSFDQMWHDDEWIKKNNGATDEYDYTSWMNSVAKFTGKHPAVMEPRIKLKNWDYNPGPHKLTVKERTLKFLMNTFGWNAGEYKNFKEI